MKNHNKIPKITLPHPWRKSPSTGPTASHSPKTAPTTNQHQAQNKLRTPTTNQHQIHNKLHALTTQNLKLVQTPTGLKIRTPLESRYRAFAISSSVFVLALLATLCTASLFAPVQSTDATTINFPTENGHTVTLTTADSLNLNIESTPEGTIASVTDNLSVTSDAPNGYQLYISSSTNDATSNRLTNTTTTASYYNPAPGTFATPSALSYNTWGYAIPSTTVGAPDTIAFDNNYSTVTKTSKFAALPTLDQAQLLQSTDSPNPTANTVPVTYAVLSNTAQPEGTYTGTITYTITAYDPKPTMQEFTNAMCDALPVSTAENPYYLTLEDERDGKTYKVSRLADNPTSGTGANNGICWMVQNLALNGTDSSTGQARVLTPSDSDVTENRTLALDMTSGTSNATSVQIIASIQSNTTTSCDTSTYPDCIVSSEPYGNLYNWYAATATTGTSSMTSQDATDSVCPKGWKLPTNGGDGTLRSYGNLMSKSGMSATNVTNHTYVQNVQKAPLYFPLSGYYSSGLYGQVQYGSYWSRTAYSSSSYAYNLDFNLSNGNFYPQYHGGKYLGYAVRCVLADQENAMGNIAYMQDMTADICQNTTEGFATTLLDRRGKGNAGSDTTTGYGVIKAKDGNCWMTDNLDLYNKTVSSTDTDLSSGSFTIPASSNWTDSNPTSAKVHVATNSGYVGQNYYSWGTAVAVADASSITTQQSNSICPKGWQLPINGGNTVDKSWAKLLNAYSVTQGSQLLNSSHAAYELGFRQYYGSWYYYNNRENDQGSGADFWSSTPASSTSAYNFNFSSGRVNPQYYGDYKGYGFSVRCVARSS